MLQGKPCIAFEHLTLQTATQDATVTAALTFLLPYKEARRKYLPADIDLSFASQRWQQLIKSKYRRQTVFRCKQLEVCIFNYVALRLSRGDLYIEGSEAYADYRNQLLPWLRARTMHYLSLVYQLVKLF